MCWFTKNDTRRGELNWWIKIISLIFSARTVYPWTLIRVAGMKRLRLHANCNAARHKRWLRYGFVQFYSPMLHFMTIEWRSSPINHNEPLSCLYWAVLYRHYQFKYWIIAVWKFGMMMQNKRVTKFVMTMKEAKTKRMFAWTLTWVYPLRL